MEPADQVSCINNNIWLARFSKLTCFFTLFLIFVGGQVTSTGSGLSVPDWPLSYGMLFPPMVGGVFYEHGHRMVASFVGLLMLIQTIWIARAEKRRWLRNLGFTALGAVILQGILGGITVKFFLPTPVSVCHGILAQSFFILTIIMAYSLSKERDLRTKSEEQSSPSCLLKFCFLIAFLIYVQLIVGALMRHTHSGLAIPDFPRMGGELIPRFDQAMLAYINDWRFAENLDFVTMNQVKIHFLHRVGALIICLSAILLSWKVFKSNIDKRIKATVIVFDAAIFLQIILGIMTVLSVKFPPITSLHVATGAAVLGISVLLILRSAPLEIVKLKQELL